MNYWSRLLFLALSVVLWFQGANAQDACVAQPTLQTAVMLAWTAPVQPTGVTTNAIILDRQIDGQGWQQLQVLPPSAVTYTDANLTPGHAYWYRVSDTAQLVDGSTGHSAYANNGQPPPCLQVLVIAAPGGISGTPQ